MRTVAFSVWIFINLAFLGMGGYIYLILSTYWCRETRQTHIQPLLHKKIKFNRENQVVFYKPEEVFTDIRTKLKVRSINEGINNMNQNKAPIKKISRWRRKSSLKTCTKSWNCTEHGQLNKKNLEKFKNKLLIQLRRVLHEESNVFKTDNPYFVSYLGPRGRHQTLKRDEIKCILKKSKLRLMTKDDVLGNVGLRNTVGEEKFLNGQHFQKCAVVSSAGSLLNSKLGGLIG